MSAVEPTPEQRLALEYARHLVEHGMPVFLAEPALTQEGKWDPTGGTDGLGYHLPQSKWQQTVADSRFLDEWEPGVAICAVTGQGVDVIDVDPRNDGDEGFARMRAEGLIPNSYGRQRTPSGGTHDFVSALGVRKLTNFRPGVDLQAGDSDGNGRGFVFLAPTVRKSKVSDELVAYEWGMPPDLDALDLVGADPSGALLADAVRAYRTPVGTREQAETDLSSPPTDEEVRKATAVLAKAERTMLNAEEGTRNDTLIRQLPKLYQFVLGGCLDEREVDERLRGAAAEVGIGDEYETTSESAWVYANRDGAQRPHIETAADDFEDEMTDDSPAQPSADRFTAEVEREAHRLRIRDAARDLVARERNGDMPIPSPVGLTDFLAEPDEDSRYRVDGLWPTHGRVVLSAQHKAGKTTLTGNLIRSLVDGDLFLGQFPVERAARIVLIDNELSPNMIRLWLREQGIKNTSAVSVLSLRGQLSGFNLLEPSVRAQWAAALGSADVLIFDCLRPALDALALSEDKDAGRFLESLDELVSEAGIGELVVVHHMGHSNERSRGDSRILDWPDAVWKLVREDTEAPQSDRYFSAYGRDVDQPEVRLSYSNVNRRLSINGGSRREAKASDSQQQVLEFVASNPGCTQSAIERGVTGDRMALRAATRVLENLGQIRIEKVGQANHHYSEIL